MWNYVDERIVNDKEQFTNPTSAGDPVGFKNGWAFPFPEAGKDNGFKYKCYKRAANKGAKEKVELTVTAPTTAGAHARLVIILAQDGKYDSEFNNAMTRPAKEIVVESSKTTASDIADDFAAAIKEQFALSHTKAKIAASASSGKLTLEAADEVLRFKAVIEEEVAEDQLGTEKAVVIAGGRREGQQIANCTVTEGALPFGTAEWLIENLRLPTAENTRYWGTQKDERPVPGAEYTQYTLIVEADRDPLVGADAVGEKLTSVTTHVVYVKSDVVSGFETLIKQLVDSTAQNDLITEVE